MSVAANSLLAQWLLRLWRALASDWPDSVCGGLARRGGAAVVRWAEDSDLCRLVWRDGRLPAGWTETVLYKALDAVANLPALLVKWIYGKIHGLWEGSLVLRGVSALGGASWCLIGLLLAAILMIDHALWNNMYALLGVMAILALFIVYCGARPGHRLDAASIGPYMILYMAVVCFSTAASMDIGLSLRFLAFHLTAFFLLLLTVSSVDSYRRLQILVALVVAGMTVGAIYGCYQAYMGVEVVPYLQDAVLNQGMPGRAYSFYDNSNVFAGLLVMVAPLNFALFLNAGSWRGRLASLASLALCVVSLSQTFSRAGYVGLVVAVVVFIAFLDWRFLPALFLLGLCCLPLLPQSVYNRILTIGHPEDSSTNYRFAIYAATGRLLRDHGLLGVGLGSEVLQQAFRLYPPMLAGTYPVHTHNTYLQIWAETGLPGLLTFAAALIHQLKASVKAYAAPADLRVKRIMAAAVAALCGILVISLVEYAWFYPRNMFLFWFLFGIIGACVKLVRTCSNRMGVSD